MKREGYAFATIVIGALVYQQYRIFRMNRLLHGLLEVSNHLLDESYQTQVDDIFDGIVDTQLEDLDDLD